MCLTLRMIPSEFNDSDVNKYMIWKTNLC